MLLGICLSEPGSSDTPLSEGKETELMSVVLPEFLSWHKLGDDVTKAKV